MPKPFRIIAYLVFVSIFVFNSLACSTEANDPSSNKVNDSNIVVFEVASNLVDCVGSMPMKCMVVNGEYFYGKISGFDYQEGYQYKLKVEKTEVRKGAYGDMPQDIGVYKFKLLKILEKESVG